MNFFDSDFLLDLNFRKRERDSIFKCDKIRDFIYFRYIVYTLESYIFQRKHVYAKIKMGRKSWKIKEIIFFEISFWSSKFSHRFKQIKKFWQQRKWLAKHQVINLIMEMHLHISIIRRIQSEKISSFRICNFTFLELQHRFIYTKIKYSLARVC